jgi:hypothetical protein
MHKVEAIGLASLLIILRFGWHGVQAVGIVLGCLVVAYAMEVVNGD